MRMRKSARRVLAATLFVAGLSPSISQAKPPDLPQEQKFVCQPEASVLSAVQPEPEPMGVETNRELMDWLNEALPYAGTVLHWFSGAHRQLEVDVSSGD